MSLFKEYEVGNLVKYDDGMSGLPHYDIAKITRINKDKTEYELEILSSKRTVKYSVDDNDANVEPIYLDPETFEKLGFKPKEGNTKWNNGILELISTAVTEVEPVRSGVFFTDMRILPPMKFKHHGYQVRNLQQDEMLFTLDDDDWDVITLHELQNIYTTQIRGARLDISAVS